LKKRCRNKKGGEKMEKLKNLLKGNFWLIPQKELSSTELSFLESFFNITEDFFYNDSFKEKNFFVLQKKEKYLPERGKSLKLDSRNLF